MRNGFLSCIAFLGLVGAASAQGWPAPGYYPPPYCPAPAPLLTYDPSLIYSPPPGVKEHVPPVPVFVPAPLKRKHVYGSAELQASWIRPNQVPVPLIATGPADATLPGGALGRPGTVLVFGKDVDYGAALGIRGQLGLWLDCDNRYSISAGGFWLPKQTLSRLASSDDTGRPVIVRPVINAADANKDEDVFLTSFPGALAGSTRIDASSQLWGGELNGHWHFYSRSCFQGQLLAGFRYVHLEESLRIQDSVRPLADNVLRFLGGFVNDRASSVMDSDSFETRNQFYGLQLGGRLNLTHGPLFFEMYGKAGLGLNAERVAIEGSTTLITPTGSQTATGGLLALPTNIGIHSRTAVAAALEAGFESGVTICPWLRVKAGYSVLFLTNVVRPGLHIDREVNPGLVPGDQNFGIFVGPNASVAARPAFSFSEQAFWVHQLNLGVEFIW